MNARLSLVCFVLSTAFLAFMGGFFVSFKSWPPARAIEEAYGAIGDLWEHWRDDLNLAPTRLLVPVDNAGRERVRAVAGERAMPGNRFVVGLTPTKKSPSGAMLLDRFGAEIHFWPIDYNKLASGIRRANNVFVHGTLPLRDGSIVVNFEFGNRLARIGPCGEAIWVTPGVFHHGISRSHDGTLWTWEDKQTTDEKGVVVGDEHIVQIDPETGRRLGSISLERDIVERQSLYGRFALHSKEDANGIVYATDPFHPNDVDVLSPEMAPAFPKFAPGDLLISLRALNTIAVLDPVTARVKWSRIGPWHRQHDPDFMPDGTISVLDNNMGLGASRILAIRPGTDEVTTVFDGAGRGNFYTWRRGRHQRLANGNVMIAESEKGRAIEVAPDGTIVWEYNNIYDAKRSGPVNEALVLPADFFAKDALRCRGR